MSKSGLNAANDIVTFAEKHFYCVKEDGSVSLIELADHQKASLRSIFPPEMNGYSPYETVCYSTVKKSGKSTISAIPPLWYCMKWPNQEVYFFGNTERQAATRAFTAVQTCVEKNSAIKAHITKKPARIEFANGSFMAAIPAEYRGEAGANPTMTVYTELWGYMQEDLKRLMAEYTIPPTRKNGMRWFDTYAGYEDESLILKDIYDKGMKLPKLNIWKDLPVRADKTKRFWFMWDQKPRMSWQTKDYYKKEKARMESEGLISDYMRLHENRWVTSISHLVSKDEIDLLVDRNATGPQPAIRNVAYAFGLDIGHRHDKTAFAVVHKDHEERLCCDYIATWEPEFGKIRGFTDKRVNLDDVEAHVRTLDKEYLFCKLIADPYNAQQIVQHYQGRFEEFQNNTQNQHKMAKLMLSIIKQRKLKLYPCPELEEQMAKLYIKENPVTGMLRMQHTRGEHDDMTVALAMACLRASEFWPSPPISQHQVSKRDELPGVMVDTMEELGFDFDLEKTVF